MQLQGSDSVSFNSAQGLYAHYVAVRARWANIHAGAVLRRENSRLRAIMQEIARQEPVRPKIVIDIEEPQPIIQRPTAEIIIHDICRQFKVTRLELFGERRTKELVIPRQLAMALIIRLTSWSTPRTGRKFGGRDHTTVIHAVRKMAPILDAINFPEGAPPDMWVAAAFKILHPEA